jgi:nicotinamide riboside kinase
MKIALLGAESTGKSVLAHAIADALNAEGLPTVCIDEYLREWCDQAQRTPLAHEQRHIAQTQMQRVQLAPSGHMVIADTSPLMTAVYSQMIFNDHALDAMAIAHQQSFDMTLLTGLDLPWIADGLQRTGEHVRASVDLHIRGLLDEAHIRYQVIYGVNEQRLAHALYAIATHAQRMTHPWADRLAALTRKEPPVRWSGTCETCGDGDCEHRLFTKLFTE